MSTITAVLDVNADGTLHLTVPTDLRHARVRVVATLQPELGSSPAGVDLSEIKTPLDALKKLRKLGGLRHSIPDPVAWQREQRRERPLPGRD